MATSGLGNYLYDLTVKDGGASFHFYDPEDAGNTADVTVSQKDFEDGVTSADSRQVADQALRLVQKQLDDVRDARIKREAAEQLDKQVSEEAGRREAAAEFLAKSKEISDTTAAPEDQPSDADTGKKK